MAELNPNHEVTTAMREQWQKICAVVMHKYGIGSLQISIADIEEFAGSNKCNIVLHSGEEFITVRLVDDETAVALAADAGGL